MSVEERLRTGLARNSDSLQPSVERDLALVLARKRRRTQRRWAGSGLAAAAAVTAIVLAVPHVGDRSQPAEPPSTAEVQEPAGPVVGEYVVDVARTPGTRAAGVAGRWVITLAADGGMSFVPPPGYLGVVSGLSYRSDGDLMQTNALIDSPGCQTDGEEPGVYRWTQTVESLQFVLVRDPCDARRLVFAGQRWVPLS